MRPLFAWLGFALFAGAMVLACSSTCESECSRNYDDCMSRAPPGAARSDCQARYQACVEQCNATRMEPR